MTTTYGTPDQTPSFVEHADATLAFQAARVAAALTEPGLPAFALLGRKGATHEHESKEQCRGHHPAGKDLPGHHDAA